MLKHLMAATCLAAFAIASVSNAQSGGEAACPDGCQWTLVCTPMKYPCGTNPDGTLFFCSTITCVDKCENCPGDRFDVDSSFDVSDDLDLVGFDGAVDPVPF